MKKAVKIILGLVVVIGAGVLYTAWSIEEGRQADVEACKTLQPEAAAKAVIDDVLRSDNKVFSKLGLNAADVKVEQSSVQIGSSFVMVPFSVSKEPEKQYVGMPRCSELKDVEYSYH